MATTTKTAEVEKTEKVEEKPEEFVGRILAYTGPTQHTRTLTKQDFKDNGFTGMDDLEFGPGNRHQIQETEDKQFSDELIEFLIDVVGDFEIRKPKAGMKNLAEDPSGKTDVAGYKGTSEDPAADTVGGSGAPVAASGSSTSGAGSTGTTGGTAGNGSST